ncbi:hypothetical protein [Streptomyces sp. B6B3]|uniref:hypothetical protein n=1 Tax=Streptomyces sp. B6B3 TaxID=3153570 RepID=UPI00325F537A
MYSPDSIFRRNRHRYEPTADMAAGLSCVICGTDLRDPRRSDAVVSAHHEGRQLLACRGRCAHLASGSSTGLDEPPLPLAERLRRHRSGA